MGEEQIDLRREFDTLEEVVNDDHKHRLNRVEKAVKILGQNVDELKSLMGYSPDWLQEPMSEKGILPLLFYYDQRPIGDDKQVKQDAFWQELNTVLDAFGLISRRELGENLDSIDERLHKLSENWAIDTLRDEVRKWWKQEIIIMKAKLDKILEYIGDQPINKTLRQEVEDIDSE